MTRAFPSPPPVGDRALYDLQYQRFAAPMAALAQEAGLCELLLEGPRTIPEVAASLKVTPRAAEAMVAVAAALGFARHDGGGRFALTDFGGTYLLPASPFRRRRCPEDDPTLRKLRAAYRSGEPPAPFAVAMAALPPAEVREFIGRMHALTLPAAGSLARQPVFGYYWAPASLNAIYDWHILEEPAYSDECWEQVKLASEDKIPRPIDQACEYPSFAIDKIVHAGIRKKAPDVTKMLERMDIGLDPLNEIIAWAKQNNIDDPEQMAIRYLETFPDRYRNWMPDDNYIKVQKQVRERRGY